MNKFLKGALEVVQVIAIAALIVYPIRHFLFQPFLISGPSMEPNFSSGEYLLIDEVSYHFGEPSRGDVVIFRYPKNPSRTFIKRVVGLPGEKVQIKDGEVTISNLDFPKGKKLNESYIEENTPGDAEVSLKEDEYFVLGDNRDHSSDSRKWGAISREDIIGKVWISVYPSDGFNFLSSPDYKNFNSSLEDK